MPPTHRQAGFTLIEIALLLGVLSILAMVVWSIYPRVSLASQAHIERAALRGSAQNYAFPFATTGAVYFGVNNPSQDGNTTPVSQMLSPFICTDGYGSVICDSHLAGSNLSVAFFTQYPGDGSERLAMLSYTYENMDAEKCLALFSGGGLSTLLASAAMTQSIVFSSDPSAYPTVSNSAFGLAASPADIVRTCNTLQTPSDGDPSTGAGMSYNSVSVLFDPLNSGAYEPFVNCHTTNGVCP